MISFGRSPGWVLRERVIGAMTMRLVRVNPARSRGEKRVAVDIRRKLQGRDESR